MRSHANLTGNRPTAWKSGALFLALAWAAILLWPATATAQQDLNAAEPGGASLTGTVTFTRLLSVGTANIPYSIAGSATNGVDYETLSGTLTIPNGQTTATVVIRPIDDSIIEGNETVVITVANAVCLANGLSPCTATVTIADNDLPSVSIQGSADVLERSAPGPSNMVVSRTGPTTSPLTVTYTAGGTATPGADYTALSGSATIPAGASSANVPVTWVNDTTEEANETVVLTITPNAAYAVNTAQSSTTLKIIDNDATVTIQTTVAGAVEGGADGQFTLTRSRATDTALGVALTIAGTAVNGTDYTAVASPVVIPANAASVTINIDALSDTTGESDETVVLTVQASNDYITGPAASATVTIAGSVSVSVTATDQTASEPGTNTGTFTFSRSGSTASALVVTYAISGTATLGTDYSTAPAALSVTIPAGSASATVTVTPIDDPLVEGNETVIVTVASNANHLPGSPASATLTIADNDELAQVTIAMSGSGVVNEGSAGPVNAVVSRTGPTALALTVLYSVAGTASGSDFQPLSGSVTIPVNAASANIPITWVNDTAAESNETIVLTITPNAAYRVESPNSATLKIVDNDASVTIQATTAVSAEGGADGQFTITRSTATDTALSVPFTIGGTAVNGTDYTAVGSPASIPANAASVTVNIDALTDAASEPDETVVLTLQPSSEYITGSPASATVTIAGIPSVTVAATDTTASEAGSDTGTFTFTRSGSTASALVVTYAISGTATLGTDYNTAPAALSVTIPGGSASATVTVTPLDDSAVEAGETVIVTVASNANHLAGSPASATVTINDNDELPRVTIAMSGSGSVNEGADSPANAVVSRSGPVTLPLSVLYSVGGSASSSDFEPLSGSVTIPANGSSANIPITWINDTVAESNETIVLTLTADAAYRVESPSSATLKIVDNDATVSVEATAATSVEGGADGQFTITRSRPTDTALSVPFTLGGNAVNGTDYTTVSSPVSIPADAASVTINIDALTDSTTELDETVTLTLRTSNDYITGSAANATVTIAGVPSVTVTATDSNAAEAETDTGTFTFTRSGSTSAALVVTYTLGGTASRGTDYNTTPAALTVTIPSGAASATVTVTPVDDFLVEANETVIATVSSNTNHLAGSPASATVTINDNDELPRVTIVMSGARIVNEGGSGPVNAVVSRTGPAVFPLTVLYSVGGTVSSADYQPLPGSLTIPVDASSANIPVNWINDTATEDNETLVLTITADAAYRVESPSSATLEIIDNDAAVTIQATTASTSEGGTASGQFTVTRSRATTTPLTVRFAVDGTAVNGTDYETITSPVTIPADTAAALVQVTVRNDTAAEASETVRITLENSSDYQVGSSSSATVTIVDNDTPAIGSLNPSTVTVRGPAFALRVLGSDFGDGAVVLWDGDALPTTFVSTAELRVTVPDTRITEVGVVAISVRSGGTTSNTRQFTVSALPTVQSLNPESITSGGPALTLTVTGTGFSSGTNVLWNGAPLPTTFASSAELTAAVPASLIATPQMVSVAVVTQGAISNSVSLPVRQLISALSPAAVVGPATGLTLTVNGAGFVTGTTVFWNETALTTTFVSATRLTAAVGSALLATPVTVQITSRFNGISSNNASFSVIPPNVPTVSVGGPPAPPVPTQNAGVAVQLGTPAPSQLEGTLSLTFTPGAGLPPGYRDPALQFVAGGPSINFVVPPQSSTAALPQNGAIQQGTVAGDIVVSLTRLAVGSVNVLPDPAPARTITVPRLPPVITANGVRITGVTANSFDVDITAYSTPRDLSTAAFTFTAAPGSGIAGSSTFSLDVRNAVSQWYASTESLAFGSLLRIRVRFTLDGNPNSLQNVTVTLANSVGTSDPVTGGR